MVAALGWRAYERLRLVLDGQDAIADGQPVAHRELLQPARTLGADVIVMRGLAADHAAERHEPVKTLARPRGDPNRGRNFERPGNQDALMGGAGSGKRAFGPAPQSLGDVSVIGRLDQEDMRRPAHRAAP